MRKRNKPFLLATLLFVFVGAAVAMNEMLAPPSLNEPPHQETPEAPERPALGEARKDDNAASAKASASKLAGAKPMTPPSGPGESPKMSIVKPNASIHKPKPNDSMTSGQWYAKEYGYTGEKPK